MKKLLLPLALFFILTSNVYAQNIERAQVSGVIIAKINSLDNITVYNESSNMGTITDSLGGFKLKVALNDVIQFSSIQLKSFKTNITKKMMDSKILKIYLKESINTLDEVVLLEHDLTGNLKTDVSSTQVNKLIKTPVLGSVDNLEVPDDFQSKVQNTVVGTQNDRQQYQVNGVAIIGLLVNAIFKTKDKKSKKNTREANKIGEKYNVPVSKLADAFEHKYFAENYNIPDNKIKGFISYLEQSGFDYSLLDPSKEMELIEVLHDKSEVFLKQNSDKQ